MVQQTKTGEMQAAGTYEIKGWDEKTWDGKNWDEVSGPKLTHAKVSLTYHGDLEAESSLQFLMSYPNDTSATSVGLEQVTGKLGGKAGSFVLQQIGKFENGVATATLSVVPGSGTGDLAGLRGQGTSIAAEDGKLAFTLHYSLE